MRAANYRHDHPLIEAVFYPGLARHPGHKVAAKQMRGFGGMLSFQLKGGVEQVKRFLPRLKYAHRAANLGAVETWARWRRW